MIIHNLNLENITFAPNETNTKLVVHPNAVLARSITFQGLKVIARKNRKVAQLIGGM
jgi:type II secretory pathway component PulL